MLEESGYVDKDLFADVTTGFKVTGVAKNSHAFVSETRLPSLTESDLLSAAKWMRHSIMGSMGPSGDPELDAEVWLETQDEVSRRWLTPVLEEDLDTRFGGLGRLRDVSGYSLRGL